MNKGDRFEQVLTEDLTRTQIVQYAGVSGDYNPVHTDEVFAGHAGFPSVFAHGMLTMAMIAQALTGWLGDPVRSRIVNVVFGLILIGTTALALIR